MSESPDAETFLDDFRAGRARRRHVADERRNVTRAGRVGLAMALAACLLYLGTTLLGTLGGVVQRLALAP